MYALDMKFDMPLYAVIAGSVVIALLVLLIVYEELEVIDQAANPIETRVEAVGDRLANLVRLRSDALLSEEDFQILVKARTE